MSDCVRMPGLYRAIHTERAASSVDLIKHVAAAQSITITGAELDLFSGTVPSSVQVPMFTDRYIRKYTVTADDKVRPVEGTYQGSAQERWRALPVESD